ncbi:MAG: hypothetical protein WA021_02055, partial [Minisyncoccia bacterium]
MPVYKNDKGLSATKVAHSCSKAKNRLVSGGFLLIFAYTQFDLHSFACPLACGVYPVGSLLSFGAVVLGFRSIPPSIFMQSDI